MAPASPAPDRLVVGYIARPHGTRGELYVSSLTDHPETVFGPGRELLLGDEEAEADAGSPVLVVEAAREFKRGLLVKLAGVDRREDAQAVAGHYLLAPLGALGPREEGEYFYHELLGAAVVTVKGEPVGTVREVYELEPADLLEVEGPGGRRHLVPFTERVVRQVDPVAKRVVIEPPPGLLDL